MLREFGIRKGPSCLTGLRRVSAKVERIPDAETAARAGTEFLRETGFTLEIAAR